MSRFVSPRLALLSLGQRRFPWLAIQGIAKFGKVAGVDAVNYGKCREIEILDPPFGGLGTAVLVHVHGLVDKFRQLQRRIDMLRQDIEVTRQVFKPQYVINDSERAIVFANRRRERFVPWPIVEIGRLRQKSTCVVTNLATVFDLGQPFDRPTVQIFFGEVTLLRFVIHMKATQQSVVGISDNGKVRLGALDQLRIFEIVVRIKRYVFLRSQIIQGIVPVTCVGREVSIRQRIGADFQRVPPTSLPREVKMAGPPGNVV